MQKWEVSTRSYIQKSAEYVEEDANKLGREGWELVTVVPIVDRNTTIGEKLFFKRPLTGSSPS